MADPETVAFLVGSAFVAGFVDSISGGGGLVTLPALLITGMPTVEAIGTNKLQSTFGTAMASYRYWKAGLIDLQDLKLAMATTFVGAAAGSYALRLFDPALLAKLIPALLVVIAAYFAFGPKASEQDQKARIGMTAFSFGVAAPIGAYDGMFGPGTGSFFAVAFVALAGFGLLKATAYTKILNLMSNLGGLLVLSLSGQVVFAVGIAMAVGQVSGAALGSATAICHGARLIRPLLVIVSTAIALRLLFKG